MEYTELRSRLETLKSEKISTVSRLEDAKNEALELAEDAISALEALLDKAPDYAFFGDEGIK